MDAITKKLGVILFGNDTRQDLMAVFEQLIAYDPLSQNKEQARDQQYIVLQFCLGNLNPEATAKIVTALSLRPTWGYSWVEMLSDEIFRNGLGTAQSFAGSVLGLFRANALIDAGWQSKHEFRQAFSYAILSAIICQSGPAKAAIRMAEEGYEATISEVVKAYVRWEVNDKWQVTCRRNEVETILLETVKKIDFADPGFELTPIGKIILDQLAYALFGMFSPRDKAKVLATRSYART
ncbi:MAG: hypothetical protein Q8Q95_02915 [bacterium]|nr:hypothetical protein [bacterium]